MYKYKRYIAFLFGFTMLGYSSGNLLAKCWLFNGADAPNQSFTLPPVISAERNVSLGGVMASIEGRLRSEGWNCPVGSSTYYGAKFTGNPIKVSGLDSVWSTGVVGVGVRIKYGSYSVPWQNVYTRYSEAYQTSTPRLVRVEFIRTTESEVGSGVINFNYEMEAKTHESPPLLLSRLTLSGSTKFVNNMGYSSCEPVSSLTNVVMGDVDARDVELGDTKETSFHVDIRCFGAKPSTPPPVNITFSGASSWTASGLLGIKEETGAASGVAIALSDKYDNKINFSPAITKTNWLKSDQTAEIYRFSGKAKYVKSGTSAVRSGMANASITYVISYL